MPDSELARWIRWINEPIQSSVLTMHHHRHIWNELAKVIRENGKLPDSAYWTYHRDIYAATQALAVRRQADLDRRVASLGRLLSEMGQKPDQVTGDWWVGLWRSDDPFDQAFARKQWSSEFGMDGSDQLDPAIPTADLEELNLAASSVKGWVDKHVAHSEDPARVPAKSTLTLDEIHEAIDVIGRLFRRYYSLLTASDMAFLEPVIQHDWLAPFRTPWIRTG